MYTNLKNVTAYMQILFLLTGNLTGNFIYTECWFRALLTVAGHELQLPVTSHAKWQGARNGHLNKAARTWRFKIASIPASRRSVTCRQFNVNVRLPVGVGAQKSRNNVIAAQDEMPKNL